MRRAGEEASKKAETDMKRKAVEAMRRSELAGLKAKIETIRKAGKDTYKLFRLMLKSHICFLSIHFGLQWLSKFTF